MSPPAGSTLVAPRAGWNTVTDPGTRGPASFSSGSITRAVFSSVTKWSARAEIAVVDAKAGVAETSGRRHAASTHATTLQGAGPDGETLPMRHSHLSWLLRTTPAIS